MLDNLISKNTIILFSIFLFGIIFWLFFWYSSDYYSYNDIVPQSSFKLDEDKITTYNLNNLKNHDINFKGDKDLIRQILKEKKLNVRKLFKFSEFSIHDWFKEHGYQNVISTAFHQKIIPYHLPDLDKIFLGDNRFFSNPIYTLSPQIILLYFFDSNIFSIINLFLMYAIGFIGCILIKKEFNLNITSFFFLFILFNFNGYWITKYSNYGASQLGYFLIPFIFYYLLKICIYQQEKNKTYYNSILLGIFVSLILLQGSVHLYVEIITFLLFWSIFNPKLWKASFIIYLVNFSTSFFRLFPALLSHGMHANPHTLAENIHNFGGYGSFNIMIKSLVINHSALDYPPSLIEFSMYVSLTGLLLISVFCFFNYCFDENKEYFKIWKFFILPIFFITIISFHKLKFIILPNWIPFFNIESITSRYIIIPFMFFFILASININRFLKKYKNKKINIYFINSLIVLSFFSLMNYARLWRHNLLISEYKWVESLTNDAMQIMPINNLIIKNDYNDKIYIYSVFISLLITIIAYSIFVLKLYYYRKLFKK